MHNHNLPHAGANETSKWDILTGDNLGQQANQANQADPLSAESVLNSELFSPEQQQEVMDSIIAPIDSTDGMIDAMDSLRSKHELRILAHMSGVGFDRWDQLNMTALRTFAAIFPSPAEFEETSSDFLGMIGRANGPQKLAQYQQAMSSFKYKVYGQKQIYWEQMQAVDALREQALSATPTTESRYSSYLDQLPTTQSERYQVERSAEWTPGLASAIQVSRTQVKNGLDLNHLESIEPDQTCQDAYLIRQEERIYGVFDGAGGHFGGREAAQAAAESVDQSCNKYNLKSGSDLAYILNAANQPVRKATNGEGYTTATLAKVIDRGGQKMLAYASIGDSRLYLIHPDGSAELVTHDEGERNVVTNVLGLESDKRTKQYGEVAVEPGDRVVICSDGITGDFGSDLMGEEELGSLVSRSSTPEAAAANLVAAARKEDDRTAVVFGI